MIWCRFVSGNPQLQLPEQFRHLTSDSVHQDLAGKLSLFDIPRMPPLS
jgi:hypothetical protein